jgi:antitoxin component of RelBE/YafQ-DinJ toxin-antitoxin module
MKEMDKSEKSVTIRISQSLLSKAREKYPELKDVSDSDVVRIMFRKVLGDG